MIKSVLSYPKCYALGTLPDITRDWNHLFLEERHAPRKGQTRIFPVVEMRQPAIILLRTQDSKERLQRLHRPNPFTLQSIHENPRQHPSILFAPPASSRPPIATVPQIPNLTNRQRLHKLNHCTDRMYVDNS